MPFAQSLLETLSRDLPSTGRCSGSLQRTDDQPCDLRKPEQQALWSHEAFLVLVASGTLALLAQPGVGFSGMFKVRARTPTQGSSPVLRGSVAPATTIVLSQPQLNALREQTVYTLTP